MEDYTEVETEETVDVQKLYIKSIAFLNDQILEKAEDDVELSDLQKTLDSYNNYLLKSNQLELAKRTAHQRFLAEKEQHESDLKEQRKQRWTNIGCTAGKVIAALTISCLAIHREYDYESNGNTKIYNGSRRVDKLVDDVSRKMF